MVEVGMLINSKINNFRSIDEPLCVSMTNGKARKGSQRLYTEHFYKLLKCKLIYGKNGSGKSNLVKGLKLMQDLIVNADTLQWNFQNKDESLAKSYFRLGEYNNARASVFEVEILENGNDYIYGFEILLSQRKILKEYLKIRVTSYKTYTIFIRDFLAKKCSFDKEWYLSKGVFKSVKQYCTDSMENEKQLFLFFMNYNFPKRIRQIDSLKPFYDVYNWFKDKLIINFPDTPLTGYPYLTSDQIDKAMQFLNAFDTSVKKIVLEDVPYQYITSEIPNDVMNKVQRDLRIRLEKEITENSGKERVSISLRTNRKFFTVYMDVAQNISVKKLKFEHEKMDEYFEMKEESDGTIQMLDLYELLYNNDDDRTFVVDEIDRGLSGSALVTLLDLFLEKAKDRNCQLICTLHNTTPVEVDILRNDEILILNKDERGATIATRGDKFKVRADKKMYAAFEDGTINVKPQINQELLKKSVGLN